MKLAMGAVGALLLPTLACATPTTLRKTPTGWRVQNATYTVDPADSGLLMPDGWTLKNYEGSGDELHKAKSKDKLDLSFARTADDGKLVIGSDVLEAGDEQKNMRVLLDRVMEGTHKLQAMLASRGMGSYETRPVSKPESVAIDGAEALELQFDIGQVGRSEVVSQTWMVVARPLGQARMVTIVYRNSPSQFPAGLGDARALLGRIHFDAAAGKQ
jgi:hypothetical protein